LITILIDFLHQFRFSYLLPRHFAITTLPPFAAASAQRCRLAPPAAVYDE
jgi:hypothetical protein